MSIQAVTSAARNIWGNPFTQAISMQQRTNLIATAGAFEIGTPMVTTGSVLGTLGHAFGSFDGLVGMASLALLIPGVMATPLGAALFAGVVAYSALKAGKYALGAVGSLLSLDFGGFLTNGLAAVGYAITALPVGRLFGKGFGATFKAIQRLMGKMPGGATFGNGVYATARHLYGKGLATNLAASGGSMRQVGQGIGGRARQGYDWLLSGGPKTPPEYFI